MEKFTKMSVDKTGFPTEYVAVLLSNEFGGGWANQRINPMNGKIIEWIYDNCKLNEKGEIIGAPPRNEFDNFLKEIGYEDLYTGTYPDFKIQWVEKGTLFYISNCDGLETIVTKSHFYQA